MTSFIRTGMLGALLGAMALVVSGCGQNKFQKELAAEQVAVQLARETELGDYELITTEELKGLLDQGRDLLLIDAMPLQDSYQKAHIAGAQNFLFPKEVVDTEQWDPQHSGGRSQEEFEELLGPDPDRPVIVYCGFVACARSHNGAAWARKLGYTDVKRYPGGIYAWKGAGLNTVAAGQ